MIEIEANIVEGLNNIERIMQTLKNSQSLPLGVIPRVQMIEQLFRNMYEIILEDKRAISGQVERINTDTTTIPE